ncbi:MAG TPA: helix-turn-helix domain-containing protein [Polyangiaceae bacterium]|nr:helix-turn-helix domain-containing protein [Polyangiaceae bacterium]
MGKPHRLTVLTGGPGEGPSDGGALEIVPSKIREFRRSASSAPPPSSHRTLRVRDLAKIAGVEPRTIHAWVAAGRIPHFRTPGRHLRFEAAVAEKLVKELVKRAARAGRSGSGNRHGRNSNRR